MQFTDNKGRETKENSKHTKTKMVPVITKPDSNTVNKIQVIDTDSNMTLGEDDYSVS